MRYRKKPVEIEAIQWNGSNIPELIAFMGSDSQQALNDSGVLYIDTLEGRMCACIGDMIIRGVNGEYYPCKPDIFEKTYEPVEDDVEKQEQSEGDDVP